MRKSKTFCVNCGKETENLIDGLCLDCYSRKGGFASIKKGRLKIELCSTCGSIKYKGKWLKEDLEDAMKRLIIDNLSISKNISWKESEIRFRRKGKTLYEVAVKLEGEVGGNKIKEEVYTEVLVEKINCPTCSRKAGKYYEAIIQLRANERELDKKEIDKMERFLRRKIRELGDSGRGIFIADRKEVRKGLDLYISDKRVAHSLIYQLKSGFGGEVKESPKLFGMKDGIRQYRMTYLLRLPRYREGDIIIMDERLFYIKRYSSKRIKAVDLKDWKEYNFRHKEISNCKVLEKKDVVKEAVVVNKRGKDVQILDPDSYETKEIVIPEDVELGEMVKIVKHDGEIFIIPEG